MINLQDTTEYARLAGQVLTEMISLTEPPEGQRRADRNTRVVVKSVQAITYGLLAVAAAIREADARTAA